MSKLLLSLIFLTLPCFSLAQNVVGATKLVSELDQSLAIKRVAVAPAQDNVDGLYASPLSIHLNEIIKADTQFDFVPATIEGPTAPENFQENPSKVKTVLDSTKAQALLSLRIERGVKGTSLKMGLSTLPEGKILFLQSTEPLAEASIEGLKENLEELYQTLKAKLPYDGLLLSRRGNQVTLNLGALQQIQQGEVMDIIQIVDIERHPKFDFLISTTKTVLGTVEITKVDENLSFARIVKERSAGIITPNAKVDRRDFVEYPSNAAGAQGPTTLPAQDVAFGDNPREWVPVSSPTFGSVLLSLGLGTYNSNISIDNTTEVSADGSHTAKTSLVPSIALQGEIWINPTWSLSAELDQSAFRTENPVSSGSPEELNFTLSQQSLMVGYNFLLTENFFGPKLQLLAGFGSHKTQLDQSQPLIFSSTTYSGLRLGIKGDMDLPAFTNLRLGASLVFVPAARFSGDPNISGESTNSLQQFRLYGSYKLGVRYRLYSALDIQSYASSFSGSKSRSDQSEVNSTSQSMTRILVGGQYLF